MQNQRFIRKDDSEIEIGVEALSLIDETYGTDTDTRLRTAHVQLDEEPKKKEKKSVHFSEPVVDQTSHEFHEAFTVLMMGEPESGKTSMLNVGLKDVDPSIKPQRTDIVSIENLKFLRDSRLVVRDCSGAPEAQEILETKEFLFKNVEIFVYVFSQGLEYNFDMSHFLRMLDRLIKFSPHAKVLSVWMNADFNNHQKNHRVTRFEHMNEKVREACADRGLFERPHCKDHFEVHKLSIFNNSVDYFWRRILFCVIPEEHELKRQLCLSAHHTRPEMMFLVEKQSKHVLVNYQGWSSECFDKYQQQIIKVFSYLKKNKIYSEVESLDGKSTVHDCLSFAMNDFSVYIQNLTKGLFLVTIYFKFRISDEWETRQSGPVLAKYFEKYDDLYEEVVIDKSPFLVIPPLPNRCIFY